MYSPGILVGVPLSVVTVIFYIISTATNYWAKVNEGGVTTSTGLWRACISAPGGTLCIDLPDPIDSYIHGARAFMIIACISAGSLVILTIFIIVRDMKTVYLKISGIIFCCTGVLVLIATSWFAGEFSKDVGNVPFEFGYSIILGWVSIVLVIISGILTAFLSGNPPYYASGVTYSN